MEDQKKMLEYQSDLEKFSNSIFIPDKNLVIIKQNIELSWYISIQK